MIRNLALAATLLLIAGCGNIASTAAPEQPAEAAEVAEVVEAPTDYLAQGKAEGYSAAVAAQTATGEAWRDVGLGWDGAMRSLGKVPTDSPDYATAQAKITEYTANRESASARYNAHLADMAAQRGRAALDQARAKAGALDRYRAEISRIDPNRMIITDVSMSSPPLDCDACIDITVGTGFLSANKAVRLEAAKNFWQIWSAYSSPTDRDEARIRLVTQSGTKVGGSGMWGGSDISVDD